MFNLLIPLMLSPNLGLADGEIGVCGVKKSIEEIRRGELIEAAYRAFVKFGLSGLTSARISREAGMSPGILNYYFKSKDEILIWMIRYANRFIGEAVVRGLESAGNPWERLVAIIEGNFPPHMFDVPTASAWVSFFSAVPQKPQFARLQALFHRRLASNLKSSLPDGTAPEEMQSLVLGVSVMIDGLWLRRGLGDEALRREEAVTLICTYIERFIGRDAVVRLKQA